MKRLFRIFELSVNEQRVVLIIMLSLLMIAFVAYEVRIHHSAIEAASATQPKPSPTVAETVDGE